MVIPSLTDAYDAVQAQAGNATWVGEILPVVEGPSKRIAEVLLWLFHSLGLCCATVGESAMYIGVKLRSHPDLLTIYIAHHQQKFVYRYSNFTADRSYTCIFSRLFGFPFSTSLLQTW
jgi:hypothetical protein